MPLRKKEGIAERCSGFPFRQSCAGAKKGTPPIDDETGDGWGSR
jgi:hypothetical protein